MLFRCIQKAATSKKYLWLLNRLMNFAIPFNKPHGFSVIKISPEQMQTAAPYKRKNFNHISGIHACAIATIGELSAGLLLMFHFDPTLYRFIMSHLDIDYHYQAKKNIFSTTTLSLSEKEHIQQLLTTAEKTTFIMTSIIRDEDDQLIASVKTTWQIKRWKAVKTKQ